jgi:hypothetical protein
MSCDISFVSLLFNSSLTELSQEPQSLLAAIVSDRNHPRDRDGSFIIGNSTLVILVDLVLDE